MAQFVIHGGQPLEGEIEVKGMKNAATPIIAASLLTDQTCVLNNVPRITDVEKMVQIVRSLGAKAEWKGNSQLEICSQGLTLKKMDENKIKAMRSSVLLLGPLLARFGQTSLPEPGGCIIGNRPLDTHLSALEALGTKVDHQDGVYHFTAEQLKGATITLSEFSVTATENVVMAASLAAGETTIKIAAAEPHVQDLCHFLNNMGAKISGIGTHTLRIKGVKKLRGTGHTIIPDQIEIGTFAALGAATASQLTIKNIIPQHLDLILLRLKQAGVNFELQENSLVIRPSSQLRSFKLQTMPYPGFPTDLQAPFAVLATQAQGTSLIQDPLFEGRMGYASELIKMGANIIVADPHRVVINGPTPLYGAEIKSFDLRAGATLIIAALVAQGETIINQAEIVDRGYEAIEKRLSSLGAKIKRVEEKK